MTRLLLILAALSLPSIGWGQTCNSEIASATLYVPCQDTGASTTLVGGTLVGGNTAADLTTTGPGKGWPLALQFDGSADYIDTGSTALNGAADFSVASWVYVASHNANAGILFTRGVAPNVHGIATGNTSDVAQGQILNSQLLTSASSMTTGAWRHVLLQREGTTRRIYVDGVLRGTSSVSGAAITVSANWFVGRDSLSTRYLNGRAAGAALWARGNVSAAELFAGFEPTYVSGADTGSFTGTTLTIAPGITWAGYSNGSVSELRDIYIDDVIWLADTALTTIDMSGELTGGEVVHWITKASNDGGNYPAADQTSGDVTYTLPAARYTFPTPKTNLFPTIRRR